MQEIKKVKNVKGALFFTYHLNRGFAQYLTFILCRLNVSPNFITCFSSFFFILGGIVLVANTYQLTFPVLFLTFFVWLLAYALDSSDGQVARLTNKCNKFGEWLDHTLDSFNKFIVVTAMFFTVLNNVASEQKSLCLIAYAVAIGSKLVFFNALMYKTLLFGQKTPDIRTQPVDIVNIARGLGSIFDDYLLPFFVFFLQWPSMFLYITLIYFSFNFLCFFIYILIRFYKYSNSVRGL